MYWWSFLCISCILLMVNIRFNKSWKFQGTINNTRKWLQLARNDPHPSKSPVWTKTGSCWIVGFSPGINLQIIIYYGPRYACTFPREFLLIYFVAPQPTWCMVALRVVLLKSACTKTLKICSRAAPLFWILRNAFPIMIWVECCSS